MNKFTAFLFGALLTSTALNAAVLTEETFKPYVEIFNADDEELCTGAFPNAKAAEFLASNIPLFQCPDEDINRTYYFRWWTYRKHIKQTPDGWVVTEFMPKVSWSAKHNTINCPAGHHFYEGRWLADSQYLDNYAVFWFRKGGSPRQYSFWAADSINAYSLVKGNTTLEIDLLDDLVKNYEGWEQSRLTSDGLFWQIDDRDGMEVSIGKSGKRATINSYMFGDAAAIARIAALAGREELAAQYRAKAEQLKQLVQSKLWDQQAQFFKTLKRSTFEMTIPKNSKDGSVPKLHWMDSEHRGTLEWVQYNFDTPHTLDAVGVYWADDNGGVEKPTSWRVLARSGEEWVPVKNRDAYEVVIDALSKVAFEPIETSAIRLEVQSAPGKSGGILEWSALGGGTNYAAGAKITKSFDIKMGHNNKVQSLNDGADATGDATLVDVRELHGFTPWYFNLPETAKGYEVAWKQLMDPQGFLAPFGPTTAEQRHPEFKVSYEGHGCQWNGPSWPFATAVTLTAMANVLNNYKQDAISKSDYLQTLKIYTTSHQRKRADGKIVSWIDEDIDPFTGLWIARKFCEEHNAELVKKGQADKVLRERGQDYNHSSYCDLVITGLVGLRPRADDIVEVNPLVPDGKWDWFCLDKVSYHGHVLTIVWDKTGTQYGKGKGLRVFADGSEIAHSQSLGRVTGALPPLPLSMRSEKAGPRCWRAEESMQAGSKRVISPYQAVFASLPKGTPSKTVVDGPLLGNGDMGVCIAGIDHGMRFWLAKNDFWKLAHDFKSGPGGPRVFGGIDVQFPGLGGGAKTIQYFYDGITISTWNGDKGGGSVEVRSWVAAGENMLVAELIASGKDTDVEVNLWVQEGNGADVAKSPGGHVHWVTRKFVKDVEIQTEAACAMKCLGSAAPVFKLKVGEPVTICAAMQSGFKSQTPLDDVCKRIETLDTSTVADIKDKHAAWWHDYWAKSFVEIGDPVLEQRYYLSNYVMACASRDPDFPPSLFGTWTTTDTPGWEGDYHLNYNHMAPFYGLYSSNHIEQADPYHAPILDFRPRAQWYAKNAQNMRGAYYPVGIGPKGIEITRNYPDDGYAKPPHFEKEGLFYFQRSNGAYCLVNIAMRWYATYDRDYAKKLYPLVRDIVDFWEDYLTFEDGRYVIYKDSIHERSGNGNDFNSIVSLGLVRNAIELAIDISCELGIDSDRQKKWHDIVDHLSGWTYQEMSLPRAKDEDKSVEKPLVKVFRYTEKGTPWWRNNTLGIQHIYPAGAIGLDSSSEELEVSRNTIDVRNGWLDGNGMNSFYPAAVRVGYDPKVILTKLREMIEKLAATNGFIRGNPHGCENCSIVPNTINEMLCMGHRGVLRLFPVWPKDKDASFASLRAWGAFVVSSELRGGEVQYVDITSEKGRKLTVQNPWPGHSVSVRRDAGKAETVSGKRFDVKIKVGEKLRLLPQPLDDHYEPASGAFLPLAPGAIEPLGWLRDWAVSMRDGMTGHLDEYDPVFQAGWLGQQIGTTGKVSVGEGWPLEQTAYWIDGAIRLGHVLHDNALLGRVVPRLEKIAGPENRNGSYLWWRDTFSWNGQNGPPVEGFELWSYGVLGRALIAHYQATGERKWLACIERFFAGMPDESLFPISRSTVNIETLFEAVRLGADPQIWNGILHTAEGYRRTDADWSNERYWSAMKRKDAEHGVTFHELVKLPLLLYAGTGDESIKQATLARHHYLFDNHTLPHGVNAASECLSGIGGSRSTESCNIADMIWSHIWLLRVLGNPIDGDKIESAFFNAAPACLSRDCRRHVYYQSPNRQNPKQNPKGGQGSTNSEFAQTQRPLCCTANIQRILPNYIIHMWMSTSDHGLAAMLYGPSRTTAKAGDGVDVTLTTTTSYPFEEDILVSISTARPVRFPLSFRVPGWCQNPLFKVNGVEVKNDGSDAGFVRMDRIWSRGDVVVIHFPMAPRVVTGRETEGSPYACVYAGPLLFARGIPEKNENESMNTGWRYALDGESDRASEGMTIQRSAMPPRWDWPYAAPVTLSVAAQAINWESANKGEAALPKLPITGKGREIIEVIPYGCAKFRVSMFPVTPRTWGSRK